MKETFSNLPLVERLRLLAATAPGGHVEWIHAAQAADEIDRLRGDLFAAFEAGFDISGEGHNAEWMHSRYTGENYEPYMRRKFQEWLDGRD